MSRLFSWDDLSQGRIPNGEDFLAAEAECRQQLAELRWITGGVFFGSSRSHTLGPCSDLDVLVAFRDFMDAPDIRAELKRLQAETLARRHVPISFSLCNLHQARSGEHRMPLGMVSHLSWAAENGGGFGQNPLPDILIIDTPAARRKAARSYQKYAVAAVNGDRPDAYNTSVLNAVDPTPVSCALDTPFHAVRRLLEHLQPSSSTAGMSKRDVLAKAEELKLTEIAGYLKKVLTFLAIYQGLLAPGRLPAQSAYVTFLNRWTPELIRTAHSCLTAVAKSI